MIDYSKLKEIDESFEWLFIITSFLQATLFQYITWKYNDNKIMIEFLIYFSVPLIITIMLWLFVKYISEFSTHIFIKIYSWLLLLSSFYSYILYLIKIILVEINIFNNMMINYEYSLFGCLFTIILFVLMSKILKSYKKITIDMAVWKNKNFYTNIIIYYLPVYFILFGLTALYLPP